MGKSSPPPAPDYVGAAQAQGAANIDTAKANSQLNNPNIVNPYGTQTVRYGGFDQAGYDNALASYNSFQPTYDPITGRQTNEAPAQPNRSDFEISSNVPTVTQQFSPEQQALYDQQVRTQGLLGGLGQQGATSLQGVVGKQLDLSGLPGIPGSASDTRTKVVNAMMGRVDEDTARQRDDLNSNLIAAGVRPGSKAYDDQMNLVNRQYNDARQQALLAGGQEAQRDFGMDTQRRAQSLSDLLQTRQVPLNEINALLSGSQVSNPFAVPGYSASANAAPAPIANAVNQQGQYSTDVYNAQAAQQGNLASGLFGLGSSFLTRFSDRRLKSNVVRLGTHRSGLPWYAYDIAGRREQGVMADEAARVNPAAVSLHASGYLQVNYALL